MAKRTTVSLDVPKVLGLIKKACRSNVVFCERMDKGISWVSEWKRTPPKSLPSPEEAAQMCAILQVDPEEILPVPEDIEKVRALINGQKKDPAAEAAEPLSDIKYDLIDLIKKISDDQAKKVFDFLTSIFQTPEN